MFQIDDTNAALPSGDGTRVGGKSYLDLSAINEKSDGSGTDATGVGLDMKRFYVSVDHAFDLYGYRYVDPVRPQAGCGI